MRIGRFRSCFDRDVPNRDDRAPRGERGVSIAAASPLRCAPSDGSAGLCGLGTGQVCACRAPCWRPQTSRLWRPLASRTGLDQCFLIVGGVAHPCVLWPRTRRLVLVARGTPVSSRPQTRRVGSAWAASSSKGRARATADQHSFRKRHASRPGRLPPSATRHGRHRLWLVPSTRGRGLACVLSPERNSREVAAATRSRRGELPPFLSPVACHASHGGHGRGVCKSRRARW